MTDAQRNFNYGYRKFGFAIFALCLGSFMCAHMHYDGIIFQGIFLGIGGAYLVSQAAVDWNKKSEDTQ